MDDQTTEAIEEIPPATRDIQVEYDEEWVSGASPEESWNNIKERDRAAQESRDALDDVDVASILSQAAGRDDIKGPDGQTQPDPLEGEVRGPGRAKRGPARKFGGHPPDDLVEMFTPEGIGEMMSEAYSGIMKFCEEPELSEKEKKIQRSVFAYYLQMRLPKDFSQFQPEMLLAFALIIPAIPRMTGISKKAKPLMETLWGWSKNTFTFLFGRKKNGDQPK